MFRQNVKIIKNYVNSTTKNIKNHYVMKRSGFRIRLNIFKNYSYTRLKNINLNCTCKFQII